MSQHRKQSSFLHCYLHLPAGGKIWLNGKDYHVYLSLSSEGKQGNNSDRPEIAITKQM